MQIQQENTTIQTTQYDREVVQYRMEKKSRTIQVPQTKWRGGLGKVLGQKKTVMVDQVIEEDHKVPYTKVIKQKI